MAYSDNFIIMNKTKTNVPRSIFDLSHIVKTPLEMGALKRIYFKEYVPNDTFILFSTSYRR